ncbi:MAG: hypothetical protein ACXQTP_05940 [Candidatus Methanofastidiosia archaeon]
MEQDFEKIIGLLEDIKAELKEIKEMYREKKESPQKTQVGEKKVISSPPITYPFAEIKDEEKWDSSSIDGLIE